MTTPLTTRDVANVLLALYAHGVERIDHDVTAGQLTLVAHDPETAADARCVLDDARTVHGWTPLQKGRWHGLVAGVVVRLVEIERVAA